MGLYETTQIYLGLATLVAALTIILYSRTKSAELDAESRRAFKPLYVVAVGITAYGIGAIGTYIEDLAGITLLLDTYMFFYLGLAIEVVLLSIAAAMILNSKKLYAVPFSTAIITVVLMYLALAFPDQADLILLVGVVVPAVILAFVGSVFLWLAKETKRSTTTTLAFALLIQIVGLPVLYFDLISGSVEILTLFFVLMGPAMLVFTFLRPDQKISFELFGYGISFAAPVLIIASLVVSVPTASIDLIIIALLSALATAAVAGTASYLYGRFRESRQIPTALMAVALFLLAGAQLFGTLGNFGITPGTESLYVEFILSGFAMSLLAVAAIYAAGWKSIASLPVIAFTPIAILIAQSYPGSVGDAFNSLWYLVIPIMGILLIPVVVFIGVWNRMRKDDAPGRLRPLGLAIGIVLFYATRLPGLVLGLPGLDVGYGLVFLSYLTMWLSLTGRLDNLFSRN